MKKIATVFVCAAMAATLGACAPASDTSTEEQKDTSTKTAEAPPAEGATEQNTEEPAAAEPAAPGRFGDYEDTGAGIMYLSTAGGTTENGNIPQIEAADVVTIKQIGINTKDGDGTLCTVYIDGKEHSKVNMAQQSQGSLELNSENGHLTKGIHTVEVVAMDGDKPVIYKVAQYECA